MRNLLYLIVFILLANCSGGTKEDKIIIGNYALEIPKNFKLIKEKGIDSYVGKIMGDSIELNFEYGYYSNKLILTAQEYLDKKIWLQTFVNDYMMERSSDDYPHFSVLKLRP